MKLKHSPIMESDEAIDKAVEEVLEIIKDKGRRPLSFQELIGRDNVFVPDCAREELDVNLDIGVHAESRRKLTDWERDVALDTKAHCEECPFRYECLAVSMTSPRIYRSARKDAINKKRNDTMPGTEDTFPLYMSEYLIFGGFVPQERLVIYERVCEELRKMDEQ